VALNLQNLKMMDHEKKQMNVNCNTWKMKSMNEISLTIPSEYTLASEHYYLYVVMVWQQQL